MNNQQCTALTPNDNINIRMSEDRLSFTTMSVNEFNKLFKDRYNTSAEDDICFPSQKNSLNNNNNNNNNNDNNNNNNKNNNNNSNNNNKSANPILKGQQKINYDALQQFKAQASEKENIPSSYTLNEKKVSLYGDNHNIPHPIDSNALRFIYYHRNTSRLYGRTLFDLNSTEYNIEQLLEKENHWLDITCPTLTEMKAISQIFGIHRLTIEDIMNQEIREKCDSFKNYLFVCYRAFVHEDNILKPITFYNIVFKDHLLTIHFDQVPHANYVQQRIEQLQEHIIIGPDWINYALIDEVTDSFAPLIQQIEQEVEMIDDLILLQTSTSINQLDMVTRIGICRKRVMQLLRLLSCKSDVIKTLMKRFDERQYNHHNNNNSSSSSDLNFLDHSLSSSLESLHPTQSLPISSSSSSPSPSPPPLSSSTTTPSPPLHSIPFPTSSSSINHYHYSSSSNHHHPSIDESIITNNSSIMSTTPTITKNHHHHHHHHLKQKSFDQLPPLASSISHLNHHHHCSPSSSSSSSSQHKKKISYSECLWHQNENVEDDRIYPDVGLYFGDVYDHILTLLQNLQHYETVLARSHSNYLARLSIELTQTSNSTNNVIGRLTIFATVLLPMNLITGLWGMNVGVPGKDGPDLTWFFWIVGFMVLYTISIATYFARWYKKNL